MYISRVLKGFMFLICIILFQVLAPETNQLSQIINILAWPQWWSLFNDMDQQGHYKKKVSSIQMGFWSDLITAFKHAIKRCLNLIFEVSFQEYQKKNLPLFWDINTFLIPCSNKWKKCWRCSWPLKLCMRLLNWPRVLCDCS